LNGISCEKATGASTANSAKKTLPMRMVESGLGWHSRAHGWASRIFQSPIFLPFAIETAKLCTLASYSEYANSNHPGWSLNITNFKWPREWFSACCIVGVTGLLLPKVNKTGRSQLSETNN
jgi:hypothetical protein